VMARQAALVLAVYHWSFAGVFRLHFRQGRKTFVVEAVHACAKQEHSPALWRPVQVPGAHPFSGSVLCNLAVATEPQAQRAQAASREATQHCACIAAAALQRRGRACVHVRNVQ
jgi:hypothetical protein